MLTFFAIAVFTTLALAQVGKIDQVHEAAQEAYDK